MADCRNPFKPLLKKRLKTGVRQNFRIEPLVSILLRQGVGINPVIEQPVEDANDQVGQKSPEDQQPQDK